MNEDERRLHGEKVVSMRNRGGLERKESESVAVHKARVTRYIAFLGDQIATCEERVKLQQGVIGVIQETLDDLRAAHDEGVVSIEHTTMEREMEAALLKEELKVAGLLETADEIQKERGECIAFRRTLDVQG